MGTCVHAYKKKCVGQLMHTFVNAELAAIRMYMYLHVRTSYRVLAIFYALHGMLCYMWYVSMYVCSSYPFLFKELHGPLVQPVQVFDSVCTCIATCIYVGLLSDTHIMCALTCIHVHVHVRAHSVSYCSGFTYMYVHT